MRIKKIRSVAAMLGICTVLSLGTGITSYANVPDDVDTQEGDGVIVELVEEDEEDAVSENEAEDEGEDIPEGILTPEGNLTLIDDISEELSDYLQYMTVQTRNGEYFYLIVDRSGKQNNVYFLNAVDEADLISILSEEDQALLDGLNASTKDEPAEIIIDTSEIEDEPQAQETKEKKGNSGLVTLLVFLVIGAGVAGAYYFLKIKPGKEQPEFDEDMEFYDDEDYINEDDMDEPDFTEEDEADEDTVYPYPDDEGVDPDLGIYGE